MSEVPISWRGIVAGVDVRQIRRRELHEALVGEVHDGAVGALTLLLIADLLHRLDQRIVEVPEVHLGDDRRLGVGVGGRFGRRAGAEIQTAAVLREARRGELADHHALEDARRRGGRDFGRAGRLP